MDKPRRLRRAEVPAYLASVHSVTIKASTLSKMYTTGGGPPCVHFGRVPLYETVALDAWVAERLSAPRRSSSETRRSNERAAA